MKDVCIFEDVNYQQLLPLVYLKPVYHLRCGMTSLQDKIVRNYPQSRIRLFCREYLLPSLKEEVNYPLNETSPADDGCLFINGRLLMSTSIPLEGDEEIGVLDGTVVYARLSAAKSSLINPRNVFELDLAGRLEDEGVKVTRLDCNLINYPWDLISCNIGQMQKDFKFLSPRPGIKGEVHKGAFILNKKDVDIGPGTKIAPGVVIDASQGPVYIGREVSVFPNAVIIGPVYIGARSVIKANAKIYGGSSIGKVCKIGGEVEASIIHAYTNKQHHGFLGHTYLGSWVNLGGGTTISDLKNNYKNIKVYLGNKWVDTGLMFLGPIVADHVKTGINSMFAAGALVGVGVNVFGGGFFPRFIPSFAWCEERNITAYQLDKFMGTAEKIMARREQQLSPANKELIQKVFEDTRGEREAAEMAG